MLLVNSSMQNIDFGPSIVLDSILFDYSINNYQQSFCYLKKKE
jgi:hypothetical protein